MSFFQKLEQKLKINVRQHAKNSSLLAAGSFVASLMGLAISVVYANFLSKETYGEYRYVLGLLNVFNSFSLTGMNVAVAQAVARGFDGVLMASIKYQLKWAIPHTLGGLVAAGVFYCRGDMTAAVCLALIAIIVPVSNAFNTYTAFLQGRKAFTAFSASTVVQSIAVYSSIAVAVFASRHVVWVTLANIGATLAVALIMHAWTLWRFKPGTSTDQNAITYGRNVSLLWGIRMAAEQIDTFLIHGFLGPVALATYAVITTVPERLKGYIKIAPLVVLPNHANRTLADIVPPLRKKLALMTLALAGISAAYALLCPLLFGWIYPLYQNAVPLAQLYGITFIFGLSTIPLTILFSQQESKVLSNVLIGSSIAQGIIMALGLWLGGLMGAIAAKLVFQLLQTVTMIVGLEIAAKRHMALASKT
ncbi:MAG: oligosaccharide flippase family protein [Patescibacteria group bacterium]